MAFDITTLALDFIATYGLLAIFVLLVLDGALLLPVFPGEIVLIMAVAAYAHDPGSLIFIILFTTAAGIVGSLMLYGVTRGGGRGLVERFPRFFMMPRKRREKLEILFQRPVGQSLVLFLRLVPLTRILVNIPAGLARMPFVRFLVLSTIGLLIYHAAFLWFTYEANRPGSAIANEKEQLQEAYASPAWEFMQANQIVTGAALLLVGAVIAVRHAAQMRKDPEESAGSLIGFLTTVTLFWGGVGLAVATYMEPLAVFELVALGGVDVHALAARVGYDPVILLWTASAVAILFGFILSRVRKAAKERKRHFEEQKADDERRASDARIRGAISPPGAVDPLAPRDERAPQRPADAEGQTGPPDEGGPDPEPEDRTQA